MPEQLLDAVSVKFKPLRRELFPLRFGAFRSEVTAPIIYDILGIIVKKLRQIGSIDFGTNIIHYKKDQSVLLASKILLLRSPQRCQMQAEKATLLIALT